MGKTTDKLNFARGFDTVGYDGSQVTYSAGKPTSGIMSGIAEASMIYSLNDAGAAAFVGSAGATLGATSTAGITKVVLANLIADLGHRGVINVKNITDA